MKAQSPEGGIALGADRPWKDRLPCGPPVRAEAIRQ